MEVRQFSQEEWYQIISQFEDLSLAQMWEYAEAKAKLGPWKPVRHLFWKGNEIVGAAQGVMRTIPLLKRGLVWICRAPLWRKNEETDNLMLMREMLIDLRKYWINEKRMHLLIQPPLLDKKKNRLLMEKVGFCPYQPLFKYTSAVIELTKSEEELRKGLKQKWRNCLNKAERLGISCICGTSNELIEALLYDYKELLRYKKFQTPITPRLIRILQNLLPNKSKMWVFAAEKGEKRLGSILIACYGHSCMYLVGAVNESGKKFNAGQFLLWQSICKMRELGYKKFDVGGANPEKTPPGILHFKQGLGGKPYRLIGQFEAYNNKLLAWLIKVAIRHKKRK